jgi:hypothetical protein
MEEGWLQWNGRKYEFNAGPAIYVGRRLSHWWGLRSRDARNDMTGLDEAGSI